jgi:acyl carrier protein
MNEVVESVRQAILVEHEIDISTIVLIRPGSLPKTSSGKIQRSAIRSAFLSESLEPVYRWQLTVRQWASGPTVRPEEAPRTLESLRDWLSLECASRLNISPDKVDVDQSIACYGLDSLAAADLVISIEESLGVLIPIESLFRGAPSISDLTSFLYKQVHPAAPDNNNEWSDEDAKQTGKTFKTGSSVLQPCKPASRAFAVAA